MIKRTLCFSNSAYLSLKNAQLVIKLPEAEKNDLPESFKKSATKTIPIEDIGVVVLDNKQITITQGVLEANHNIIQSADAIFFAVIDCKSTIFESKSQPSSLSCSLLLSCYRLQKYNF